MKQAIFRLFATAFFLASAALPRLFPPMSSPLWAEQDPLYENVVVETFDGPGASTYPDGSTLRVRAADGGYSTVDIAGQAIIWHVDHALASRYATEGFPTSIYTDNWPIDLFGFQPQDSEGKQVLGIRAKFDRQGYNYFALYAGAEIDGEWQAAALPLFDINRPGQVKNINLWVWGASYDYSIQVYLRDYKGVSHALPLRVVSGSNQQSFRPGSLMFAGWRKMAANIPDSVAQDSQYGQQDTRLKLVKFVIQTSPYERVDDFYIYFDQLQSVVDPYSTFYDGKELARADRIQQMWGDADTAAAKNDAAPEGVGQ